MKTPREVLLARHQAAEPKLDKVRRDAVADLMQRAAGESDIPFVLDRLPKLLPEKPLTPSLSPSDGERVAEGRERGFPVTVQRFVLATMLKLWRELVLPRPQAWAAVAAMWVVICALKLSTPEATNVVVQKSSASPEVLAEVRQQKLLFAELVGVVKPQVATPTKATPPQPRSDRRLRIPIG